jgi:membrane fusion protein (multidrug efflux system)
VTSGRYVETDDAYVQAARTVISADVSGRIMTIEVKDNQRVTKGQILYRIDPAYLQAALNDAKAQLGIAKLQVEALKATYQQKLAENKSAQETLDYSQREYDRQKKLLGSGVSSQSQFDQASNALEVARQRVASTQQDIENTLAQLGGNPDVPANDHPMVQRAQAIVDQKQIDVDDTVVRAPENGTVTKVEQLQIGDYMTSATPVFSLMSDRLWVEANFKETELTNMRPGQEATVEIDTYPDVEFHAKVESLSPGTGLTFSLLPPENATGNWVKVVQRLPVRLVLENVGGDTPLHAGLSATVNVDTQYRRPWLVWLQRGYDRFFGTARAAETK